MQHTRVQPSDPLSFGRIDDTQKVELFAKMKANEKIRKEIVAGFFKDVDDIDRFCEFFSALERLHNRANYELKKDYDVKKDLNTVWNPTAMHHFFFLATHPLASEFGQFFETNFWTVNGQLSPKWFSTLLTLAEHNQGKLVLNLVKSVKITDADFWTFLLKAASRTVEVGKLAALAEKTIPGKIDPELLQSCKAFAEELKTMNIDEWECCAKTKTGHVFRPNHNILTDSYKSTKYTYEAFPAIVPNLLPSKSKPFLVSFKKIPLPTPLSGITIHSKGTSVYNPAQFSLPDLSTLEAMLRAKCRHLRIHHFPTDYISENAKRSFPLLSIKLDDGDIADDRDFIEALLKFDVLISKKRERMHDLFVHLATIFEWIIPGNKYVEYRDQRRDLSRKALSLIDNDTTLSKERREQLFTVLGAIFDYMSANPHAEIRFHQAFAEVFTSPEWSRYLRKRYPNLSKVNLEWEASRVFAPLLHIEYN